MNILGNFVIIFFVILMENVFSEIVVTQKLESQNNKYTAYRYFETIGNSRGDIQIAVVKKGQSLPMLGNVVVQALDFSLNKWSEDTLFVSIAPKFTPKEVFGNVDGVKFFYSQVFTKVINFGSRNQLEKIESIYFYPNFFQILKTGFHTFVLPKKTIVSTTNKNIIFANDTTFSGFDFHGVAINKKIIYRGLIRSGYWY